MYNKKDIFLNSIGFILSLLVCVPTFLTFQIYYIMIKQGLSFSIIDYIIIGSHVYWCYLLFSTWFVFTFRSNS